HRPCRCRRGTAAFSWRVPLAWQCTSCAGSCIWTLSRCIAPAADADVSRQLHRCEPLQGAPDATQCSVSHLLQLKHASCLAAFDVWSGWPWGASLAPLPHEVQVFTDGSFDRSSDTSAWSVAVA